MTRKSAREIAVQLCFAAEANHMDPTELLDIFFSREHYDTLGSEEELFQAFPDERQMEYIRRLTLLVTERREEIDEYIERYSRGWKPERISHTALAVLRCAICEILYMEDVPSAAAINEAVEVAKGYDDPDTVSFVNGVLGGFMRGEFPESGESLQE
ncbi:MAG: transcription antitermination factor NusB [Oscillospiraceae bacterium]|nr:transcription antitermination factor NusB [Oscillospiraceae bacterium]